MASAGVEMDGSSDQGSAAGSLTARRRMQHLSVDSRGRTQSLGSRHSLDLAGMATPPPGAGGGSAGQGRRARALSTAAAPVVTRDAGMLLDELTPGDRSVRPDEHARQDHLLLARQLQLQREPALDPSTPTTPGRSQRRHANRLSRAFTYFGELSPVGMAEAQQPGSGMGPSIVVGGGSGKEVVESPRHSLHHEDSRASVSLAGVVVSGDDSDGGGPDDDDDGPKTTYQEKANDEHDLLLDGVTEEAKHLTRRERLARFMGGPVGYAFDISMAVLSAMACVLFVLASYYNSEPEWITVTDILLSSFFLIDLLLRLYIAESRVGYLLSLSGIVDVVSVLPVFAYLASGEEDGDKEGASFSDFLFLRFIRFLRVLRVLRVIRVLRGVKVLSYNSSASHNTNANVQHHLMVMAFTILALIFCSAGFFQVIEEDQNLAFHDACYFVVSTLTTLGMGDIQPDTTLGRMLVIGLLGVGVVLIPYQTHTLLTLLSDGSRVGHTSFRIGRKQPHVVVTGHISHRSVFDFLTEFFHIDHGQSNLKVVIVSDSNPDDRLRGLLRHPTFVRRVVHVRLSPLNSQHLERLRIKDADAVFVLTDKYTFNPNAQDETSVLHALSIRNTSVSTKIFLQLLQPDRKHHALALGCEGVYCLNELKLALLGRSCFAPGLSTLVGNLLHTHSILGISAQRSSWLQEYGHGLAHEVYALELPKTLAGMTFSQAAVVLFRDHAHLLFAILADSDVPGVQQQVAINPGKSYVIRGGEKAFVLGVSSRELRQVKTGLASEMPATPGASQALKPLANRTPLLALMRERSVSKSQQGASRHTPGDVGSVAAVNSYVQRQRAGSLPSLSGKGSEALTVAQAQNAALGRRFSDHIIVCGALTNLYHFVHSLRDQEEQQGIQDRVPLVILAETGPEEAIWAQVCDWPDIYIVRGSPQHVSDMIAAGVGRARKLVYLSSSAYKAEEVEHFRADYEGIFALVQIDLVRGLEASGGASDIHSIVEFGFSANVSFLRPKADIDRKRNTSVYLAPNYCAGRVFSAALLDSLLASAYYNEWLIEIVYALVADDACQVRQVSVPPELIGKPFVEVFEAFALSKSTIVLGIYRAAIGTGGAPLPYVYTCPHRDSLCGEHDKLFVVVDLEA